MDAVEQNWIVRLRGLRKTRSDDERVFEVCVTEVDLAPGSRLALLGESGSGKSTVLSLLALATHPERSDQFEIVGKDILAAWDSHAQTVLSDIRAHQIAYLPQRDGLLEFLTIRDNILCCAQVAGALPVNNINDIVGRLALTDLLDCKPARLSGGQRQRAAVACALARRPRLILADEPTAALDAVNAARVMQSLCDLAAEIDAATVLATHDLRLVETYGFNPLQAVISGSQMSGRSVFEHST